MMNKKVLLMILDGWGITQNPQVSAPALAKTPYIDHIREHYPHSTLRTDGEYVGLPEGQMGNSEVGHMNIGAGRIVYQNLVRINKAVREDTLKNEQSLLDAIAYARTHQKAIHLLGLVSDGGIHSHIEHLKGILKVLHEHDMKEVFVHAFTDGRDCDPQSGIHFIKDLETSMKATTGKLASIIGRYYAMDRDHRRERVKKAYDLLVHGKGKVSNDPLQALQESYASGVTDEFVEPIIIEDARGQITGTLQEGDVVLFFNYRTDRGRELTQVLSQEDFPEREMKTLPLYYLTMTNYDKNFKNIHIIYDTDNLQNTL